MEPGAVKFSSLSSLGAAGTATLTKKGGSSSRGARPGGRKAWVAATLFLFISIVGTAAAINLSPAETRRIGKKIWQNECGGTLAGLTSWNSGENFASLGIGHFIWYPRGGRGPFEESFPRLVDFVAGRGARLPEVLIPKGSCPWNSRGEFNQASQTVRMKELRQFLANTVDLQAAFLVERLQKALPKMVDEAAPARRERVRQQFERVAASPGGYYALVDYVNFKGEGVLATERYAGQGWGLLQVLEGMSPESADRDAVKNFAESAKRILTNRVRNAPPERSEGRWLPGWLSRINTYVQR
ncbi:MAG TPA: hypothetical protein VGW39_04870 [Chthoniobacterales bacterium]|nr:hypothetical protein [Chthoniobacterales bacterium]